MEIALGASVDNTMMYADDATCASEAAFRALIDACGVAGKKLAKAIKISPGSTRESTEVINGLQVTVVPAARLLGAFMGRTELAVELLRERIAGKLEKLNQIAVAGISVQAKWQITRSLERSIVWDATATKHSAFNSVSEEIDQSMRAHLHRCFLLPGTELTHKSMELLYLPSAHGGVGSVCFRTDAEQL